MSCCLCREIYALANCLSFAVWFICESLRFPIFIYSRNMYTQSYTSVYLQSIHSQIAHILSAHFRCHTIAFPLPVPAASSFRCKHQRNCHSFIQEPKWRSEVFYNRLLLEESMVVLKVLSCCCDPKQVQPQYCFACSHSVS